TVTPRNAVGGIATFDDASIDKAGTGYTLVASSGGLDPATSGQFNVTAAAAASIAPSAGDHQTATVGTAVATPPAVIVRDQFNNPVAGVAVTFAPAAGSGSVSPTTPIVTNASGVAALTSWTLGTTAGPNSLTAPSTGLTGSPVTFLATGAAGPATPVTFKGSATAGGPGAAQPTVTAAPATITAGAGSSTITVTVRDANGNPVSGATVTLAVTPATGSTLTQPAGTTNAAGQITGSLSSTAAGAKTVRAIVNSIVR